MQYDIIEARSHLARLVKAALSGEEVIISRRGAPVVRLVTVASKVGVRKPGAWAYLPPAADDWDSPETNVALADELSSDFSS